MQRTPPVRSLVICRADPLARGGSALRNFGTIKGLQELGPVAALILSANVVAAPDGARSEKLVLESVQRVTVRRAPAWLRLSWLLSANPRSISGHFASDAARSAGLALVESFRPNLVVGAEAPVVNLALTLGAKAPVVYDAHNIETSLRREITRALRSPIARLRASSHARAWASLESEAYRDSDAVWCCSEEDAAQARTISPKASVRVVPTGIDLAYYQPAADRRLPPPPLERGGLNVLLTGGFDYLPNEQAAQILLQEVLPRLRSREQDVRVVLAGQNPRQELVDLASRFGNVTVTGSVDDIRPYLQWADMMIAPILIGGGTRVKFLEAFASRCPVITTRKGAEGLPVTSGRQLLIGDTPSEITDCAVTLARDPSLRAALTSNAWELVAQRFSLKAIAIDIRDAVADLI